MKLRFPRWLHRLYARAFGYFWLPCDLCGTMSGGHEWKGLACYLRREGDEKGICPACELRVIGTWGKCAPEKIWRIQGVGFVQDGHGMTGREAWTRLWRRKVS